MNLENQQYTLEELNKTGIYSILNLVNGKQYVGSTAKSFKLRWNAHKNYLRRNKHHSNYLQRSWNKYTEDLFQFIIIEYCEPDQCITREQHYINSLNVCDKEFGYNICPIAGSTLGRKCSDETKLKGSLARTGRECSEETRTKLRLALTSIKRSDETIAKLRMFSTGKKHSDEAKAKMRLAHSKNKRLNKTYVMTDLNDNEIITHNLKEFCIINDLSYQSMLKKARGKVINKFGWECRILSN